MTALILKVHLNVKSKNIYKNFVLQKIAEGYQIQIVLKSF